MARAMEISPFQARAMTPRVNRFTLGSAPKFIKADDTPRTCVLGRGSMWVGACLIIFVSMHWQLVERSRGRVVRHTIVVPAYVLTGDSLEALCRGYVGMK